MFKKYTSYALYFLIAVLIISLYIGDFSGLKTLQWKIDDVLYSFRGEKNVVSDIVLVNIDDISCDELGNWPWSYSLLADLVATVNKGEPKSIVINMDLPSRLEEDTAGYTQVLANQISWINNAILTYDVALAEYSNRRMSRPQYLFSSSLQIDTDLGIMDEDVALKVRRPFMPSSIIAQYADGLGFNYVDYDSDRKVRWAPMLANYDGYYYPSAPLLAAAIQLGFSANDIVVKEGKSINFGSYTIPIDKAGRAFINYSDPEATFSEYSAISLIREKINLANLKNKLVIIGVTQTGASDVYRTPVAKQMDNSKIQANIIENIMHQNYINRLDFSTGINLLILLGFGVFCSFILPRVTVLYRMIILFICAFLLINLNFILFNQYNILMKSLYLGLEIFLFMLASPMLEESRNKENMITLSSLIALITGKNRGPHEAVPKKNVVPTRQIRDTGNEPEFQKTEMLDQGFVPQYQTPQAAVDNRADERTSAFDSTPTPEKPKASSPPEKDDLFSYDPSPLPAEEPSLPPLERENISMPPAEQKAASRLSRQKQSPVYSSPSMSSSPHSGSGSIDNLTHLGRYQIVEEIGKGAMGTVFKGTDPAINRSVALKTIRFDFVSDQTEMEELRDRLIREARAAGKLSHPNIVTIYDIGTENNFHYIAMEYLEGQTLEEMIKRKVKFSYKIIANIISQICMALQYAHDQGIVHRDIKPANIMILPDYSIKVMDFGIARVDSSSMTRTGVAMGTPNYIAPELLQGKQVDRRCDIFSLGVVFYEVLTGRRPFKGENLTSLIYSIINDTPRPPSSLNDKMPLIFDHITLKALAKNPIERFQKASDIKSALSDFVGSFDSKKVGI